MRLRSGTHYRLSLGETGVVLGAVGIGMLLTLLPWGLLADQLSERIVIAIGLSVAGVAIVAAGRTHSYGALVAVLFAAGAFGASVNAASGRAVMGWFPERERGLALGVRQTAIPIGGAAAAAGLPWLASAGGTRLAFLVLGCLCVGGAVVAAAFIRDAPSTRHELEDVTQPMRDPRAWLLGVGTGLYLTRRSRSPASSSCSCTSTAACHAHSALHCSPESTCSASVRASARGAGRIAFVHDSRPSGRSASL